MILKPQTSFTKLVFFAPMYWYNISEHFTVGASFQVCLVYMRGKKKNVPMKLQKGGGGVYYFFRNFFFIQDNYIKALSKHNYSRLKPVSVNRLKVHEF